MAEVGAYPIVQMLHPNATPSFAGSHHERQLPPPLSRNPRKPLQAQRRRDRHQHREDGAADARRDLVALALSGRRVALVEAGAGAGCGGRAGGLRAGAGARPVRAAVAHGADAGLARHRLGRVGGC